MLGVDMSSTGEVGCIGDDTSEAILKAMLSVGYSVPKKTVLISGGTARSKVDLLEPARMLHRKGYVRCAEVAFDNLDVVVFGEELDIERSRYVKSLGYAAGNLLDAAHGLHV